MNTNLMLINGEEVESFHNFNNLKFTSDTHFGSQRTLELSRRPFSTIEEMDEYMILLWNKIVKPDDVVIHLGDFGNFDVRERLNGKLILIQGNYEEELPDDQVLSKLGENDIYCRGTFDNHANIIITYNDSIYFLTHRPLDCKMHWAADTSKYFNLFGHIHGRQFIKKFGIDVGVDAFHFRPFTWDDILFFKNAVAKGYYDENVFC